MKEFGFEIDEINLEISEGLFTTITGDFSVSAGVDDAGNIEIFNITAQCGRNSISDPANWQRIDDMPAFAAIIEAIKKAAPGYAPDLPQSNPNTEHRLLASELV